MNRFAYLESPMGYVNEWRPFIANYPYKKGWLMLYQPQDHARHTASMKPMLEAAAALHLTPDEEAHARLEYCVLLVEDIYEGRAIVEAIGKRRDQS
jgi:hypothetical protein